MCSPSHILLHSLKQNATLKQNAILKQNATLKQRAKDASRRNRLYRRETMPLVSEVVFEGRGM